MIDSVFLRSLIQATDAMFTGWTAKIIAANHAPGIFSFTRTSHSSSAAMICCVTLPTWYPIAWSLYTRYSSQSVLQVTG